MTPETISFSVGYKHELPTFHLRMISMAEENAFNARFVDIADKDPAKDDKQYQIKVDALADWSVQMPTRKEDGEDIPLMNGQPTPAATIKAYFAEKSTDKEWIAEFAIRALRIRTQPEVTYL